jgi:environmental stress-induced protein Ves
MFMASSRILRPTACEFSDDAAIHGMPLDRPVRDFNLMLRRSHVRGRVTIVATVDLQ